ncbi:MAG: MBL fold metallo-hydrolase [Lachnospiraceae bacterium]|nr:MBL fold metallo-hydrolase [Lachnospiraceae bacterium]
MKLTFIGATHEVTGSCHYVEACGKQFIVDYGMEQGKNFFENVPLPVKESQLDFVLLTHAHVDHSGMLPLLYKNGFTGKIFATDATADLCEIMLRDCAHIQMQEAEWRKRKGKRNRNIEQFEPIYKMEDAEAAIRSFIPCPYDKEIKICDGITIRFTDVGHLLGSASIELWLEEDGVQKKICFSGDLGASGHPLIREAKKTEEADIVLIESTYGTRIHAEEKPDYVKELAAIVDRTLARGGNVVIPAFAVGRTQEMLYFLRIIKQEGLVKSNPDFPVYVDSPMAVSATEIFQDHVYDCFAEEALELVRKGVNPISFQGLELTITPEESRSINDDPTPKVILSASGMCDAGRIKHHLKHNLWRPESTVCFVGHQSVGTPGRTIKDGADEIRIFGEPVQIRAEITWLKGMSGHADKNGLIDWMQGFTKKPQKVFVVHGEAETADAFAQTLHDEYGFDTYAPYSGTEFDLKTMQITHEAVAVPVVKKPVQVSTIFGALRAAGDRLMSIISRSTGLANKDMKKFTEELEAMADKWEIEE